MEMALFVLAMAIWFVTVRVLRLQQDMTSSGGPSRPVQTGRAQARRIEHPDRMVEADPKDDYMTVEEEMIHRRRS